jgi:hypothetical protein
MPMLLIQNIVLKARAERDYYDSDAIANIEASSDEEMRLTSSKKYFMKF